MKTKILQLSTLMMSFSRFLCPRHVQMPDLNKALHICQFSSMLLTHSTRTLGKTRMAWYWIAKYLYTIECILDFEWTRSVEKDALSRIRRVVSEQYLAPSNCITYSLQVPSKHRLQSPLRWLLLQYQPTWKIASTIFQESFFWNALY